MLTLRQLRYLEALARQRHFGRAALECAVTQPALSMQIHQLEEFLGGELVERRQGDVVLTDLGLQISERAACILSAARDLVEYAHHAGRLLAGTMRLGVIPTLAPYILPLIIPELQRDYPDLSLVIIETKTNTLLNELTRGNIDLALLALPADLPDVEALHLFDDRFLLALPVDDPLPEQARVMIADVDKRNLLLLEEGHCISDQALAYCGKDRTDVDRSFFATSLTTVMQMVASGYGVTLLPEVAVNVEVHQSRVKLLRFADPQPHRSIGLIWRRTSPCKADFRAFGKIVLGVLDAPLTRRPPCEPLAALPRARESAPAHL